MSHTHKTLGIIGFGKEGQAIFQYYRSQFDQIYVFDEKLISLETFLDDLPEENFDTSKQITKIKLFKNLIIPREVDFLVKSPGIATHRVVLQNPKLQIQSLISLLFQKLDMSKVIAITGTKGKSTTSSLIFHILYSSNKKVELLGNIGNINIKLLDNYDPETYYIFELSSFQCQQLTCSPHIAIWTNFFIDHQDVHSDMKEYYEAKANICRFQMQEDFLITVPELKKVQTPGHKVIVKTKVLSDKDNVDLEPESQPQDIMSKIKYVGLKRFETKLIGLHNQVNCQLASEACRIVGIEESQIVKAISSFAPIKGRLEKVNDVIKNQKLIEFYTDDLATIPEATWQAILAFEGQVTTLITGGYDKGSDYTRLASDLVDSKIKNIIYFNPTGSVIVSKLDPTKVNLHEAQSMQEAVKIAFELTTSGVCLLSCASASFGMFKNAYDRGEQYRECIVRSKRKLKLTA